MRLFVQREPGELQLLLERIGFRLLAAEESYDALDRSMVWTSLVFRLEEGAGTRPVELADIVGRLLIRPNAERDVTLARAIYSRRNHLECVWSGAALDSSRFAVDHVIHFWSAAREADPLRFSAAASRTLPGGELPERNWESRTFAALLEAVETVAL